MKYLVSALAFAPLLIAATPAPPETPQPPRTVMIERVDAPAIPGRHGRVVLDFTVGGESGWTREHDAVLDEAMENLREALAALPGDIDADVRFDWRSGGFDGERVRMMVDRARERAGEAREAAMLARLHGERARVIGLQAGARGMEAGLRGIDEALERGEITRNGETRAMTADERAELIETRERLAARIAEFREEHAVFLGDDSGAQARVVVLQRGDGESALAGWLGRTESTASRRVRIEDIDGRLRVWLDGEELEGDALTAWLNSDEGQSLIRQRPEPPLLGGE